MSQPLVAKRYAVALFEIANDKALLDQFEEELLIISEAYTSDKRLRAMFENPRLSIDKKKQFVKETFSTLTQEVNHTLQMLVERRRINALPEIVSSFVEMKNEARGIAEADVYSVKELSESERRKIETVFTDRLQKDTLHIRNTVDSSLLGGVKIRIGNKIYDGTVSTKLHNLERQLLSQN